MWNRKPNIVVVGASGHAKVVIDIVEKQDAFLVAGLIDSFQPPGTSCCGYRVLGTENDLPGILREREIAAGILAIGNNWQRRGMRDRILAVVPGFRFATAIHPSAQIARDVTVGQGTVIMAGAIINPCTHIGDFCIVNTKASLDHDCVMEEFSCVLPGATAGGNVRIGAFSAVCLGANVIHGVTIGAHSVIGAGSLVLDDVPDYVVAYGTPARTIRERRAEDPYLSRGKRSLTVAARIPN